MSARTVIRLVRTASFSSAHRYFDVHLTEAENRDVYGSWYREKGFGHNFRIEAHFEGEVDPLSGMIVNLTHVDRWLKVVVDTLDHRHLNECAAFQGRAPTPERIAAYFFTEVTRQMSLTPAGSARLVKIRLYEGETLWVDCGT